MYNIVFNVIHLSAISVSLSLPLLPYFYQYLLCSRFCICMLHEQFTRWLTTLHKIILAHHDEHCECDCGFCVSCGDLDSLSIGGFMRLMLCPPSLRFHGSTIPLFDWNCIDDKYVCFLSLFRVFNFYSF